MEKFTKVTDKTKFRILVDLCQSNGIDVCKTYQESFEDSYPKEDVRWWVFALSNEYYGNGYKVYGTSERDKVLCSYEDMIDAIIGVKKSITFSLADEVDAIYTQQDRYIVIGGYEVDIIKLEELLTKVNQLNA